MFEFGQRHAQRRTRKRKCTSSKYKGVHRYVRTGMWQAKIKVDGRCHHLGYFRDETEAAHAYDRAAYAVSLTARGNFPISDYPEFKAAVDEARSARRAKVARCPTARRIEAAGPDAATLHQKRDQNR